MSQFLPLSRAARLVGVTRGALQKKIKDGELETFEGMVSADDLLRVFPDADADFEANALLERVSQIKDSAFGKRVRERVLPDAEVLAARLGELGIELEETKGRLRQYVDLVESLDARLKSLQDRGESDVGEVRRWLRGAVAEEPVAVPATSSVFVRDSVLRLLSAHVRMEDTGHDFFVEGSDALLDAGLRAGLMLDYGCSDGSCGRCKARVLTGQVKPVREVGYALNEQERRDNVILMCAHTAVTDLVLEAPEAREVGDMPVQTITASVVEASPLNDAVTLVRLKTPPEKRLRFMAGQRVSLKARSGPSITLPVASCPCVDRTLEFHFASQAGSGRLGVDDEVTVNGPTGDFVLRHDSDRPLLLVAIDTGFAPIKSLIEHAMALETAPAMYLEWASSSNVGQYLDNLCRAWADALDEFHYSAHLIGASFEHLVAGLLDRYPHLHEFEIYVAGPKPAVSAVCDAVIERRVPKAQLHADYVL